jgi:hypothetical protein
MPLPSGHGANRGNPFQDAINADPINPDTRSDSYPRSPSLGYPCALDAPAFLLPPPCHAPSRFECWEPSQPWEIPPWLSPVLPPPDRYPTSARSFLAPSPSLSSLHNAIQPRCRPHRHHPIRTPPIFAVRIASHRSRPIGLSGGGKPDSRCVSTFQTFLTQRLTTPNVFKQVFSACDPQETSQTPNLSFYLAPFPTALWLLKPCLHPSLQEPWSLFRHPRQAFPPGGFNRSPPVTPASGQSEPSLALIPSLCTQESYHRQARRSRMPHPQFGVRRRILDRWEP